MALVPRSPRDKSLEEKERFEKDREAYQQDPVAWGGPIKSAPPARPVPMPPKGPIETPEAVSEPISEQGKVEAPPEPEKESQGSVNDSTDNGFQPLTDEEMEAMTRELLVIHAKGLPDGQDFTPHHMLGKKKLIKEIKVRYGTLNLHKSS